MTAILSSEEYLERMLSTPRPGEEKVLAFYEHRLDGICTDPRLMCIPLDDHIVHRGDGVFETMKWVEGRVYQLDQHLKRLLNSCRTIFLTPPIRSQDLRGLVLEVAAAAGTSAGLLSVFVGRGPGGSTTDYRECPQASLYVVARRFQGKSESFREQGVTAFKSTTPAKQCYLSRIKSVDYLPNVLMKREAVIKGYDYPFCFDDDGFLAEGATENICILNQEGQLIVPELRNALPGTTLLRGLELIKDDVPVYFQPVREDAVYLAREVILMGTTIDALNVVRYNDKPIHDARPGDVGRRLRELLVRDQLENGVVVGSAASDQP
ncbi:MAG: aminotransferase class IV [Desulfohalobiaceae bacterium]